MQIRIDPLDPLFFRDGRPFTMGDDSWGGGIFPPPPGVLYGVLRSAYFAGNISELPHAETEKDPTTSLKITSLYWLYGDAEQGFTPHLALPQDCVRKKRQAEKDRNSFHVLKMRELKEVAANCPLPCVLYGEGEVESGDGCLVDAASMAGYLRGSRASLPAVERGSYLLPEEKTGIGLQMDSGAALEGMLYRVQMNRWQNLSLVVQFEGLELPAEGLLKLGGEGKAARYSRYDYHLVLPPPGDGEFFKAYLATPAIFQGGWLPGWLNHEDYIGESDELKIQLVTAAIGRPQYIGGFDMKKNRPKAMRRAAPAGSVYYFKILSGHMQDVVNRFHGRSISDFRADEGFGLAYVGAVS